MAEEKSAEKLSPQQFKAQSNAAATDAQTQRRKEWEASPEGKTRTKDIVDYATEEHNKTVRANPHLGLKETPRLKMTPNQLYEHYGFKDISDSGPGMHDRQLPGLEDPHARPQPKRWEEHTPQEQSRIQENVKRKTGATLDTMTHDYGSQIDQAYMRARKNGTGKPYGGDFYTNVEEGPAHVLRQTAKKTGAPLGLVAAVNADTSPQMKFSHTTKEGKTSYPNAEQAEHAIRHIQSGGKPEEINKEGLTGLARAGFNKNLKKAAHRADAVLNKGAKVGDTTGSSSSGFGPKTAAYHNSWLPSTPDFTVSDVHTGGGGFLPHLSSFKGGDQKKSGSERERGISTTGFHAMADYAARNAMKQRGLGKVRQAQAVQWGEERIRRNETGNSRDKAQFPSEEQAYSPKMNPQQFPEKNPNVQGRLF